MKIITLVKKRTGFCAEDYTPEQYRSRMMQEDVKRPCLKVKRFSFIEVEEAEDGRKVYELERANIFYKKGEYVNLTTLVIASVGLVAVSVFAYQKFKK